MKMSTRGLLSCLPLVFAAQLVFAAGSGGGQMDQTGAGAADVQPAPQTSGQNQAADGELSLVEADGEDTGSGDELDLRIAELEDELALTQEEADRVRLEQEELRSRLDDLDAQIAMARQLIDLREQELAELQATLVAEAAQSGQQAAPDSAESTAGGDLGNTTETAFAESLLNNPVVPVVGVVILVLALVLVLIRRGRSRDEAWDREGNSEGYEQDRQADTATEHFQVAEEASAPSEEDSVPAEYGPSVAEDEKADSGGGDGDGGSAVVDEFTAGHEEEGEEKHTEQLNLAYSLQRMGDTQAARQILEKLIRVAAEPQVDEARRLLAELDDAD